jgi:glycosyltransferase involved in cell wall biosynthesis
MRPHTPLESILVNSAPRVTIIIPTIGRPKYIADTLRSVLAQECASFNVLISDNAPAVATADVLREQGISDARVTIVSRSTRLGFSEHMNACIAAADGEFVMILSDDDQLSRRYVAEMVEMFSADSAVTVGLGRQSIVNEHDLGLLQVDPSGQAAQTFDGLAFLKGTLAGSLSTNVVTYISLFARRADILAVGGFKNYPDGSHADNFVLFQLALRGRVVLGTQRMLYRVYATSHGLGTPFPALLEATRAYSRDCANALGAMTSVDAKDKASLTRMVKRSNAGMLRGRLRTIYVKRVSKLLLLRYFAAAVRFALTPAKRL